MKNEFTEEDKKREAFLRIANALHSHWRVSNPEEKRSLQCGGHTRLFDVLIPDAYITVGESVNGKDHREHVVPCALIRSESYRMFNDGCLIEDVTTMIEQNLKIVHITKEERQRLDVELALKITTPEGWGFEQNNPFARLEMADIEYRLF